MTLVESTEDQAEPALTDLGRPGDPPGLPLRIAFLHLEAGEPSPGVLQKHATMLNVWRDLGMTVESIRPKIVSPPTGIVGRFRLLRALNAAANDAAGRLDDFRPDVVYAREMIWTPATERIMRGHPVVLELNGDAAVQLRRRSRSAAAFWGITAGRLHRHAKGYVAATEQIVASRRGGDASVMVVGNPVFVSDTPPARDPQSPPLVVMLVGERADRPIATNRGIDRLVRIAARLPGVRFRVLGGEMPTDLTSPSNLDFAPAVPVDELERVFASATASLGSLAPHRSGLTSSRALKIRTSLASGVPVVLSHDDPDLPSDADFLLRVRAREEVTDTDVERIDRFIRRAWDDPSVGRQAWRFAARRLSGRAIEPARLRFLASVASR